MLWRKPPQPPCCQTTASVQSSQNPPARRTAAGMQEEQAGPALLMRRYTSVNPPSLHTRTRQVNQKVVAGWKNSRCFPDTGANSKAATSPPDPLLRPLQRHKLPQQHLASMMTLNALAPLLQSLRRRTLPTLPRSSKHLFHMPLLQPLRGDAACAQCQGHRQQSPIKICHLGRGGWAKGADAAAHGAALKTVPMTAALLLEGFASTMLWRKPPQPPCCQTTASVQSSQNPPARRTAAGMQEELAGPALLMRRYTSVNPPSLHTRTRQVNQKVVAGWKNSRCFPDTGANSKAATSPPDPLLRPRHKHPLPQQHLASMMTLNALAPLLQSLRGRTLPTVLHPL